MRKSNEKTIAILLLALLILALLIGILNYLRISFEASVPTQKVEEEKLDDSEFMSAFISDYEEAKPAEAFATLMQPVSDQSVTIEDYTIALDQVCYETTTRVAYCRFAVTSASVNYKKTDAFTKDPTGNIRFGQEDRFLLAQVGEGYDGNAGVIKKVVSKNKMYLYYRMYHSMTTSDTTSDAQIYLMDGGDIQTNYITPEQAAVASHCFTLTGVEDSVQFVATSKGVDPRDAQYYKGAVLTISPLRYMVQFVDPLPRLEMVLTMEDGSTVKLNADTRNSQVDGKETKWMTFAELNTVLDVQKIQSVNVNGITFQRKKK